MNSIISTLVPSFFFTLQFSILFVGAVGNILFSEKVENIKYILLSKYGINNWIFYKIALFTLFAVCQIIAFYYARLAWLWLILGIAFLVYTIIIFLSKSSFDFEIGNKRQWQNILPKLKRQRRIAGLLEFILLLLWSYSWSEYIMTIM